MFDKYLIVEDSFRSTAEGFAVDVRLGYYRGLGLSMVEDLALSVDGETIDPAAISFDEGPGPLSLGEMAEAYDRRWEFGAKATLTVARPGGLASGEHRLELTERLRISYLPFPSICSDTKFVKLV